MSRKTILFYAQVCYLDIALEYISLVSKSGYEVHVLIELPPSQLKSNIFDLEVDLSKHSSLTPFSEVKAAWKLEYLSEYFEKCASVHFVVYKTVGGMMNLLSVSRKVQSFIQRLNPDYLHFDDISPRLALPLLFLLQYRKRFIMNIHDPKQHTGEFEWKRNLLKKCLFQVVPSVVVYSTYSKSVLEGIFKHKKKIQALKLLPYTVFAHFQNKNLIPSQEQKKSITFIGRISPYKGINLFAEAIEQVLQVYPNQTFTIAGKPIAGFTPDYGKVTLNSKNVSIIEKHLSNEEMSEIISDSQLVVCPYLEATQSGVIMTSYALGCPVLVTNVGGLPEYVLPEETGIITKDMSSAELATSMINFIKDGSFEEMNLHLTRKKFAQALEQHNVNAFPALYS